MLLAEMLKIDTTQKETDTLLASIRICNAGSNHVAKIAFRLQSANQKKLHHIVYRYLRTQFKLPAQMAVRAIAKTCEAYKKDKSIQPKFHELGAVQYDQRMLTWKWKDNAVSILTLSGRITVPVLYSGRWWSTPGARVCGQVDLIYRDSNFYLAITVDVPNEPIKSIPTEWLGVDLGIVNIAADSDGVQHSGKAVRAMRARNRRLRQRLQSKGTKSAKRLLHKRRRKESRYARDVNHVISKKLVSKAKGTGRGISLEELGGIRDRITVRKVQRADQHSWSFYQLRKFIEYKATLAGVVYQIVSARNTSRLCPRCELISDKNRTVRDYFKCIQCGLAGPADIIAAINIGRRAVVMHAARGAPVSARDGCDLQAFLDSIQRS
jgi:IS605 OrfB family transposase